MDVELWLDHLLAIGVLTIAWLSLSTQNLLKSIVLFISLGLFVTLIWARLNAWDVAMAEAAIGAGLTGALLLATWHRLKSPDEALSDVAQKKTANKNYSSQGLDHVSNS